ncbi:uncharacterized protein OCT59_024634 [Rhizophagus irregularis]|uniref:uncharacterized protein n=1 Tax=Rhizophagus irregularis TaxID=588596 RepID=UPI00331FAB60|nr:hypothetical protein OCT59_024634 [Rhizophagus irregularis]
MPSKISTICYIHDSNEKLTQEYTVKEITAVSSSTNTAESFQYGYLAGAINPATRFPMIFLLINATSIKVIDGIDFDTMPPLGLSVILAGITTKTVRNVNGSYALEFYVEENLGDREPQQEFWVEVNHDPNIRNLSNKTNSINQSMRSTTAIIVSLIKYEPPVIDEMIANDVIRSTMLDSLYELELYAAVLANQIHTCSSKCYYSFVASESSFFVGQTFWSSLSFFVGMLTFGYLTPNEPELIDNFGCNRWF